MTAAADDNWAVAGSARLPAAAVSVSMICLMRIIRVRLVKSFDDAHEAVGLQGCATDQTAVYVGLAEQLLGVGGLAAAAVQDRSVVGYLLTVFLGYDVADVGVHVLSLLGCGGLAGTGGPYGLVCHDDLGEVFGSQREQSLYLTAYHVVVCSVFTLLQHLAYAEDGSQTVGQSQLGLGPVDLTIAALTSPV